jgi:hypothetical protein
MEAKLCYRCQISKPLSEFYLDKSKRDGHTAACKACLRAYSRERKAHVGQKRGGPLPKYRSYRAEDQLKAWARSATLSAIERGLLRPEACQMCGEPKSEGHHPDYSEPLDVVWLCSKHHAAVHRGALEV